MLNEYPKAITTLITGLVIFLIQKYLPEAFNGELASQVYTIVFGIVVFFLGRFLRMSKTDAEALDKLKNPY